MEIVGGKWPVCGMYNRVEFFFHYGANDGCGLLLNGLGGCLPFLESLMNHLSRYLYLGERIRASHRVGNMG